MDFLYLLRNTCELVSFFCSELLLVPGCVLQYTLRYRYGEEEVIHFHFWCYSKSSLCVGILLIPSIYPAYTQTRYSFVPKKKDVLLRHDIHIYCLLKLWMRTLLSYISICMWVGVSTVLFLYIFYMLGRNLCTGSYLLMTKSTSE